MLLTQPQVYLLLAPAEKQERTETMTMLQGFYFIFNGDKRKGKHSNSSQ